ncbi:MAG: glycosyltransferase [Bacteroidales bacterium]|nr:glycosyltransferase [Lachnoclostridium sp.]MCM1383955.1 glycosyltransferase [Lachnoclostridium sp.]MCM1464664.1 glycosyltransferase [Bacteroidales bacterium]
MDKISVIIPCYNVEQYIDRCLESVVTQTIGLDMLEIIVVNDASTDGTLEKLYQWEKRFPENIMVITYDENLRQGGARNLGLQYATGEYVGFVDSDDWIEPDMYELLYEKMSTGKYDLVNGKYIREYEGEECSISRENRHDKEYHFTAQNGLCYGVAEETGNCGFYGGLWSGLYKNSMLKEKEIWFPEHLAYEDNHFLGVVALYVKNLYIVDVVLYHYFFNQTSTIATINGTHHITDRLTIETMLVEDYKKRGAFEIYHDEIEKGFLERFFCNTWHIIFMRFDYIPDIMDSMKKVILELFPNYKENPSVINDEAMMIWLELLEADHIQTEELEKIKDVYRTE